MANTVEIITGYGKKLVMKIEPCPFCGDDDIFICKKYDGVGIWHGWQIVCPNCNLVVCSNDHENKRELVQDWNRRAK